MSGPALRIGGLIPGLAGLKSPLRLKVGVLEGATNEDGEKVAEYATYNEFGAGKIPARPALRTTLDNNAKDYEQALAKLLLSGMDPELALKQLGEVIRGNVVESIRSWEKPPNAPKTILLKLKKTNGAVGNAPLYETGAYAGSINYEVEKL